jgi:KDO2-lipid IV(A) lauroyltransferase
VALTLAFHGPLLQLDFSEVIPPRRGRAGLAAMTQDVADWFSSGIRRSPADWHMLQAVFRSDVESASR